MTPDQLATGGPATLPPPIHCEGCRSTLSHEAFQYRCDECNAPVCAACAKDGPAITILCEACHKLHELAAGARARSIHAHRRRPNNPNARAAFPHPVNIPFTDWSNYGQKKRRGIVAAIEYHYDETARIYRPHAVFTAVEATPEERARHVGGRPHHP